MRSVVLSIANPLDEESIVGDPSLSRPILHRGHPVAVGGCAHESAPTICMGFDLQTQQDFHVNNSEFNDINRDSYRDGQHVTLNLVLQDTINPSPQPTVVRSVEVDSSVRCFRKKVPYVTVHLPPSLS